SRRPAFTCWDAKLASVTTKVEGSLPLASSRLYQVHTKATASATASSRSCEQCKCRKAKRACDSTRGSRARNAWSMVGAQVNDLGVEVVVIGRPFMDRPRLGRPGLVSRPPWQRADGRNLAGRKVGGAGWLPE